MQAEVCAVMVQVNKYSFLPYAKSASKKGAKYKKEKSMNGKGKNGGGGGEGDNSPLVTKKHHPVSNPLERFAFPCSSFC